MKLTITIDEFSFEELGALIDHRQAKPHLTPDEMRIFVKDGKIPAIKAVRDRTGLGLREAKELVEAYQI